LLSALVGTGERRELQAGVLGPENYRVFPKAAPLFPILLEALPARHCDRSSQAFCAIGRTPEDRKQH